MRYYIGLLIICWMGLQGAVLAQSGGSIRGKAMDEQTGEPLIGAAVQIKQTGQSTITDIDGNFILSNIPVGDYDLECSYLGYVFQRVIGLRVREDGILLVYFKLKQGDAQEVGIDVVVTAEAASYMEAALLARRKNSSKLLESISAEEIFRTGDLNAGEALRRLAGVTIEQDRYVYIRGLGGRYVRVLLNGFETTQMDLQYTSLNLTLFSASIIDHITVYKSFSADVAGSFAGGGVDVQTRSFPERFTIEAAIESGYNPSATLRQDFTFYQQGNGDWFAVGEDNRLLPPALKAMPTTQQLPNSLQTTQLHRENLQAFSDIYSFAPTRPVPNLYGTVYLGGQWLWGKRKKSGLSYNASFSYKTDFFAYRNGENAIYRWKDGADTGAALTLSPHLAYTDQRFQQNAQWTAMFNVGFKLTDRHRLRVNIFSISDAQKYARIQDGKYYQYDSTRHFQTRTWFYEEKLYAAIQVLGKHAFGKKGNLILNWKSSFYNLALDQPDLRFFGYSYQADPANPDYRVSQDIEPPSHYFRDGLEGILANYIDLDIPIRLGKSISSLLRLGGVFTNKTQNFVEKRYFYFNNDPSFNGNPQDYIAQANWVTWSDSTQQAQGLMLYDATVASHNYTARELVAGGYFWWDIDWTTRLKTNFGFRSEYTNYAVNHLATHDTFDVERAYPTFLPSVGLKYTLRENMFLRASWSYTIARPLFRELSGYDYFEYIGDYTTRGNRALRPTLLNNTDLRWEWFLGGKELLALGAFVKHFKDPIERIEDPNNHERLYFENAPWGILAGIEAEIKKDFGFVSRTGKDFSIVINAAYIYSMVKIRDEELARIRQFTPDAPATRPLLGQAPYVLNAGLHYQNEKSGTQVYVGMNVTGSRLVYVLRDGLPAVYELPRPLLDVTLSQKIHKYFVLRLVGRNLLNMPVRQAQQWEGNTYYYTRYQTGQTISLGIYFLFN